MATCSDCGREFDTEKGKSVHQSRHCGNVPYYDEDTLRKLSHDEGMSLQEIADKFDTDKSNIHDAMDANGIDPRPDWNGDRKYRELDSGQFLHWAYVEEGLKYREIREMVGCSKGAIDWALNTNDIDKDRWGDFPRLLESAEGLHHFYVERGWNSREIGDMLGSTKDRVVRWLRNHGIPVDESGFREGENHHGWKDGSSTPMSRYGASWWSQRRKTIERDGYSCQICGIGREDHVKEYGCGLPVHHIESFDSSRPPDHQHRLGNLVTLCSKCHPKVEQGTLALPNQPSGE